MKLDRLLETLGPAALAGAAFLYDFPAGEIASVVVAQILGSLEAQRPAVAVNESAVLALGLVGVFDDRFSRLPLFVLSGLRGGHLRLS